MGELVHGGEGEGDPWLLYHQRMESVQGELAKVVRGDQEISEEMGLAKVRPDEFEFKVIKIIWVRVLRVSGETLWLKCSCMDCQGFQILHARSPDQWVG